MSYLDPPRFSFAGQFFTNPSTVNNSTENYPLDVQYNNNPPSQVNPDSVWWNQYGQAFFQITSGTVNGACLDLGTTITSSSDDAVIGAQIVSIPTGSQPSHNARLVDLDPDQQARSLIIGMMLQIATTENVTITGTVRGMTIIDVWGRVAGGGAGGITSAGAMYQSVLDGVQWNGMSGNSSSVLKQLQAICQQNGNMLSFKFNVDAYNGTITDPNFGTGRIVGTVGPYYNGEPAHLLAQRRMYAGSALVQPFYPGGSGPTSPLNAAPFQISGGYLSLDLGNSIPTSASYGGPFANLGTVNAIADPNGASLDLGTVYSSPDEFAILYNQTAGILELSLTSQQEQALAAAPLALQIISTTQTPGVVTGLAARSLKEGLSVAVSPASSAGTTLALAENTNGLFSSFDFNALRLQQGAPGWSSAALSGVQVTGNAKVPLYATVYGKPASGTALTLQSTPNQYQFNLPDGAPWIINNNPMSAITFPAQVTVSNGMALVNFVANALSQAELDQSEPRRSALNSQLYTFAVEGSMDNMNQPLTVLVFVNDPPPASPTWTTDISPIFTQYARLYPFMRRLIDLSEYQSVVANIDRIQMVMNLPPEDPGFMPVTRDLAPTQLAMLNTWFAKPSQ